MKLHLLFCSMAVAGLAVTSCIDDNYDLDNIDTTSRINVNNLVIPVNIEDVYLSDVIHVDEESQIQIRTINGQEFYVITEKGSFNSDPINIKGVTSEPDEMTTKKVYLSSSDQYSISEIGNEFSYECYDVDDAIVEITGALVNNLTFTLILSTPGITPADYSAIYYTDLVVQLPTGLTPVGSYDYDATTGLWKISRMDAVNGVAKSSLVASAIEFGADDTTFENHTFTFSSDFSLESGKLVLNGSTQPASVELDVDYELSTLDLTAFSGKINYQFEGMNFDPISLSNRPKFLEGDQTNLILENALLCLNTNNPVAVNDLSYEASLTLTAYRENELPLIFGYEPSNPNNGAFSVGYEQGDVRYNSIFSANKISTDLGNTDLIPEGYNINFKWFEFQDLGQLLSAPESFVTKGLPQSIDVTVNNPQIPLQDVKDFAIGRDIPGVDGEYEFYAPLALQPGSVIVYTDVKDGWGEDVQCLTINKLTLRADAVNNTSLDAQLIVYPLDKDGNRIPGIEVSSNTLQAFSSEELLFELTGSFTGMDGIEFYATIVSQDGQTIKPSQAIELNNIRAMVDGYYEKEL